MATYGTAPRKVNGTWQTSKGRVLSPAGQKYWQRKRDQGFVDDTGHTTRSHTIEGPTKGMVQKGNIDLAGRRKALTHNPDGSISSVDSIGITENGKQIVIPKVIPNAKKPGTYKIGSDKEAIDHYHKTGQHLGIFKTQAEADNYAEKLHENLARDTPAASSEYMSPAKLTKASGRPKPARNIWSAAAIAGHGGHAPPNALELTAKQQRQQAIYKKSQQATAENKTWLNRAIGSHFATVEPTAAKANKTVNPAVGAALTELSPLTATRQTIKAVREHKPISAAVSALGIVPFGAGNSVRAATDVERGIEAASAARKAERAAAVSKAGLEGKRAAVVGEKAQQFTRARSHVTQNVIEKPADIVSEKLPAAPLIGKEARVAKAAGRATGEAQGRAQQSIASHAKTGLPKKGSDEDAAHFYWAHLPDSMHNTQGLQTVRAGLQRELDRTLRREPLPRQAKASKTLVAKQARVVRLQAVYDKAVARSGKAMVEGKPRAASAISQGTPTASSTVQRLGGALSAAKDELATAEKRATTMGGKITKGQKAALPAQARNLAIKITQLDRIIAKNPTANPAVFHTLRQFEAEHVNALQQAGFLENVNQTARRHIVANWLNLPMHQNEGIYIGHRPGKIPGAGGLRSLGLGKPKIPKGAAAQNRLRLFRTGGFIPSTHVAAGDLAAAQTYHTALIARKDLWEMAGPEGRFRGHVPDGYSLINPEGQVVPATMKTDQLAGVTDPAELEKRVHTLLKQPGFLADHSNYEAMVAEAKATGAYDKLRVIPTRIVDRYYKQFLPAGPRGAIGKTYDKMIDMTALSLIFGRIGYIPKNILQALITVIPHQGLYFPLNAARATQLAPRAGRSDLARETWDFIVHEMGGGTSGALAREATTQALHKPAEWVTGIADSPPRVSAFIHEAAAHGVIPKASLHLSDADMHAILALKNKPADLHDIRHIATDAMGDFNRLTPAQRRVARRAFIVPGWLVAGSRYPLHFAATHPGRAAALGYVAAGEPGAPKSLQVNKPVTSYLEHGFPSYIQAVSAGHWPGLLGGGKGKVERVQSVLPGAIPFDVGLALSQGAPIPTAASYFNPFPEAAYNIARGVYETPSGETKKTTFTDALRSNLQRLAPTASLIQGEIAPGSVQSRIYPDHSRIGMLKREAGVIPVTVDKNAAKRAQLMERGMTKSVAQIDDKTHLYDRLKQAGEKPSKVLDDAYALKLEWKNRLDKIHSHGLTYYQKAYKVDIALAVERKLLTPQEAKDTLAAAKTASQDQLQTWHNWFGRHKFGGQTITEVKDWLSKQGK
jgi:hypothetical protein